ncbi:MAG: flagellar basal-body rod protein FlgF [Deltaproteobacteria bacterium]|nr:MAG: flagellar basal-body rod protein FlgF [Deltaproteobacteria bacterium]
MSDIAYNAGLIAAASGAMSRLRSLDIVTNNLANSNTPGFKRDVPGFDAFLVRAQQGGTSVTTARLQRVNQDRSPGEMKKTGNPLDVAIMGRGFFQVQDPATGQTYYTRQGNFSRNAEGTLVTSGGKPVIGDGGPLTLPAGSPLEIRTDGTVLVAGQTVGQLRLFDIPDDIPLSRVGEGLLAAPNGFQADTVAQPHLMQGWIEQANVQPLREMTRMVTLEREFESYQKLIHAYGQLAGKAAEIGAF